MEQVAGQFALNTKEAKSAMASSFFNSVGNIFQTAGLDTMYKSTRKQMVENAKYQAKEVADVMGSNALNYLKSGVGMSGSALEVINQNAENGYSNIQKQLQYTTDTMKQQLKSFRNQMIISSIGNIANLAIGSYQGGGK